MHTLVGLVHQTSLQTTRMYSSPASTYPPGDEIIGIDLGTTNSCVAVVQVCPHLSVYIHPRVHLMQYSSLTNASRHKKILRFENEGLVFVGGGYTGIRQENIRATPCRHATP